jgi:hypothetical protein
MRCSTRVVTAERGQLPRHRRDRRHHDACRESALQDIGPPVFRSVVDEVHEPLYRRRQRHDGDDRGDFRHRDEQQQRQLHAVTVERFINGANETAVRQTDPTAFNADRSSRSTRPRPTSSLR